MKIGTLFVRRPVMTTMVFMGVALFGFLSWNHLPQELFPNISIPQLIVITKYPTAAPEEIENLITKPIEEAVGTVANITRVTSISKEGMSAVKLEFVWGTDMDFAHLNVREKLDRMKDRLPDEAAESIIKRVNPFTKPVMVISITGGFPLEELTELCKDVLKKKLEKVEGVGAVIISGGREREYLVEVDRGRLEASRVSLPMVVDALKNSNYDYPAGTTEDRVKEILVRTEGRFKNLEDIKNTVVYVERPEIDPLTKWTRSDTKEHIDSVQDERIIPLRNLAEVKEFLKDRTTFSRYNGKENISLSIQKQADANTIEVSKGVKEALAELRQSLPPSISMDVVYDESNYIRDSLKSMRNNVIVGGALAFVILLIFLGKIKDALSAGLAIPISILTVLILMFFTGLSVNVLTLAGLALAVGTLSDAAIVVTENIVRHKRQFNKSLIDAAIDGSNEVAGSMVAASLTNVVVFLPLLFISGVAQQLFQDLFLVTMFTAAGGLFVSLSLIPRLSAYKFALPWTINPKVISRLALNKEKREVLNQTYARYLVYALKHPSTVGLVLGLMVSLAIMAIILTPKVFMPKMDQGEFIVRLDMPIGTRLEITNTVAQRLENILLGLEGLNVMVNIGSAEEDEDIEALRSHQAQVVVTLDKKNHLTTNEVLEKFKTYSSRENLEGGHLTYLLQDSPLRAALAGEAPIAIEIKGPDFERLQFFSREIQRKLEMDPVFFGVKSSFALPSFETQVIPNKDKAAQYDLSVFDIARTALVAIKGEVATKFKEGGKETDIRVRLRPEDRDTRSSIRLLTLRTSSGKMVTLDNVAQIQTGMGTSEIRHFDQQRAVMVSAEVGKGSVGAAIEKVKKMISEYRAYKDYTVILGGESQKMSESFSSLRYTLILAVILVYMIMAAEFESFVQPLIIMITVPFSFMGVAYTLFFTNTPFSSVVVLGILILAGLVVNNGIVLIDHMNGLRAKGLSLGETVLNGSVDRLRPILITSFTTILAVLPLALGLGRGDDLAQPLAVVTFGGMLFSTALTLFVVPLLYYQIERRTKNP